MGENKFSRAKEHFECHSMDRMFPDSSSGRAQEGEQQPSRAKQVREAIMSITFHALLVSSRQQLNTY